LALGFGFRRLEVKTVRRYALTAERFDARQAKEIGLVNEVW